MVNMKFCSLSTSVHVESTLFVDLYLSDLVISYLI